MAFDCRHVVSTSYAFIPLILASLLILGAMSKHTVFTNLKNSTNVSECNDSPKTLFSTLYSA